MFYSEYVSNNDQEKKTNQRVKEVLFVNRSNFLNLYTTFCNNEHMLLCIICKRQDLTPSLLKIVTNVVPLSCWKSKFCLLVSAGVKVFVGIYT